MVSLRRWWLDPLSLSLSENNSTTQVRLPELTGRRGESRWSANHGWCLFIDDLTYLGADLYKRFWFFSLPDWKNQTDHHLSSFYHESHFQKKMPSSSQILSALAAMAVASVQAAMGPAFSTGPVGASSWIREATSTLVLPDVPSGSGVSSLWVGMGTDEGDLIQSISDNFQSDKWAIFAYTLVKTGGACKSKRAWGYLADSIDRQLADACSG